MKCQNLDSSMDLTIQLRGLFCSILQGLVSRKTKEHYFFIMSVLDNSVGHIFSTKFYTLVSDIYNI